MKVSSCTNHDYVIYISMIILWVAPYDLVLGLKHSTVSASMRLDLTLVKVVVYSCRRYELWIMRYICNNMIPSLGNSHWVNN